MLVSVALAITSFELAIIVVLIAVVLIVVVASAIAASAVVVCGAEECIAGEAKTSELFVAICLALEVLASLEDGFTLDEGNGSILSFLGTHKLPLQHPPAKQVILDPGLPHSDWTSSQSCAKLKHPFLYFT